MTHRRRSFTRPLLRAGVAGVLVAIAAGASPAFADEPSGSEYTPPVSVFHFLVIVLLIPLGLALVISVLAALPSWIKGDSYSPGQPWVGEGEWFGGPRKTVDPADEPQAIESAGERGGGGAGF